MLQKGGVNFRMSNIDPQNVSGTMIRALLNGGEPNGGCATFVWQERAQTRATQTQRAQRLKKMGETPTGGHILVKNLNFPQFYS